MTEEAVSAVAAAAAMDQVLEEGRPEEDKERAVVVDGKAVSSSVYIP